MRLSDRDKLIKITLEYAKVKNSIFTSEMIFDYILNQNIKFKKAMSTRRIGRTLSTEKDVFMKMDKVRNHQYFKVNEDGVVDIG